MKHKLLLSLLLLLIPMARAAEIDAQVIDQLAETGTAQVIIELAAPADNPLLKALGFAQTTESKVRRAQDQALANIRKEKFLFFEQEFEQKYRYQELYALAGSITPPALEKLQSNPAVRSIKQDTIATVFLAESIPIIGADTVHNLGYTGAGQAVCILDTGVHYGHDALGGCSEEQFLNGTCVKVPIGHDFYNDDANPMDDHGHGTHVAGIAVGAHFTLLGITRSGVAPDATLLAGKICSSSGTCPTSDIIAGIEWCTQQKDFFNLAAISLSLGSGRYDSEEICKAGLPTVAAAIAAAAARNISVVAASGNQGYTTGIASPACQPNTTSVGATNDDDTLYSVTNRAGNLDLLAPGRLIKSTILNGRAGTSSGTSMATPHVAGSMALLQQANPSSTPQERESLLNTSGTRVFDSDSNRFYARINIDQALGILEQSFTLNLSTGWNLISLPLEVEASLPGIFEPIQSSIVSIQMIGPDNTPLTYLPGNVTASTLMTLNLSRGMWIHMRQAETQEITASPRASNVYVRAGWNLLAHSSTQSTPVAGTIENRGITRILTYMNNTWTTYRAGRNAALNTLTHLEPGKGYWIFKTRNETLS